MFWSVEHCRKPMMLTIFGRVAEGARPRVESRGSSRDSHPYPATLWCSVAGLVGPAATIAVRQAGIAATIYEAHPGRAEDIGSF
jgi:hypothetical protein